MRKFSGFFTSKGKSSADSNKSSEFRNKIVSNTGKNLDSSNSQDDPSSLLSSSSETPPRPLPLESATAKPPLKTNNIPPLNFANHNAAVVQPGKQSMTPKKIVVLKSPTSNSQIPSASSGGEYHHVPETPTSQRKAGTPKVIKSIQPYQPSTTSADGSQQTALYMTPSIDDVQRSRSQEEPSKHVPIKLTAIKSHGGAPQSVKVKSISSKGGVFYSAIKPPPQDISLQSIPTKEGPCTPKGTLVKSLPCKVTTSRAPEGDPVQSSQKDPTTPKKDYSLKAIRSQEEVPSVESGVTKRPSFKVKKTVLIKQQDAQKDPPKVQQYYFVQQPIQQPAQPVETITTKTKTKVTKTKDFSDGFSDGDDDDLSFFSPAETTASIGAAFGHVGTAFSQVAQVAQTVSPREEKVIVSGNADQNVDEY